MVELVIEKIRANQMLTDVMYDIITQHTYVEKKKGIVVACKSEYLENEEGSYSFSIPGDLDLVKEDCYRVCFEKILDRSAFYCYLVFDIDKIYVDGGRIYERIKLRDVSIYRSDFDRDCFPIGDEDLSIDWDIIKVHNDFRLSNPLKLTRHYETRYVFAMNRDSYVEDLKKLLIDYKNDLAATYGDVNSGNNPNICVEVKDGGVEVECHTIIHYEDKYHIHAYIKLYEIGIENKDNIYFESLWRYPSYSCKIEAGEAMKYYPKGYGSLEEYLYDKLQKDL